MNGVLNWDFDLPACTAAIGAPGLNSTGRSGVSIGDGSSTARSTLGAPTSRASSDGGASDSGSGGDGERKHPAHPPPSPLPLMAAAAISPKFAPTPLGPSQPQLSQLLPSSPSPTLGQQHLSHAPELLAKSAFSDAFENANAAATANTTAATTANITATTATNTAANTTANSTANSTATTAATTAANTAAASSAAALAPHVAPCAFLDAQAWRGSLCASASLPDLKVQRDIVQVTGTSGLEGDFATHLPATAAAAGLVGGHTEQQTRTGQLPDATTISLGVLSSRPPSDGGGRAGGRAGGGMRVSFAPDISEGSGLGGGGGGGSPCGVVLRKGRFQVCLGHCE